MVENSNVKSRWPALGWNTLLAIGIALVAMMITFSVNGALLYWQNKSIEAKIENVTSSMDEKFRTITLSMDERFRTITFETHGRVLEKTAENKNSDASTRQRARNSEQMLIDRVWIDLDPKTGPAFQ